MHISLAQFDGPLPVLLALIEKQKLDISEIALARVTEQYVTLVNEQNDIPFRDVVHFVEMASRLIVLKTRLLIPYLAPADDEPEDEYDIIAALQAYQTYRTAAKKLIKHFASAHNTGCKTRMREIPLTQEEKANAGTISKKMLHKAFARVHQQRSLSDLPPTIVKRIFNLQEKINQIADTLRRQKQLQFSDLIKEANHRSEFIVNFLAILELSKSGELHIKQGTLFQEINLLRR